MTEQQPLPDQSRARSGLQKIGFRRISIAIMLVGAAGFVAALLIYHEQVLCLSGSTLVTLGGLALLITARKMGLVTAPVRSTAEVDSIGRSGKIPAGLRKSAAAQAQSNRVTRAGGAAREMVQLPSPFGTAETAQQGSAPGTLAERTITVLESQGARVLVEKAIEGRAILRILLDDGQEYVALVIEGGPAGTAEARALLALVSRYASGRGYLIAQNGFLPEAYDWAAGRGKIRLVSGDELDELGV